MRWKPFFIFNDSNVNQVYSGGTFKKSMNYYSFRETEKRSSREVQDISISLKIVSILIVIIVVIFPFNDVVNYFHINLSSNNEI